MTDRFTTKGFADFAVEQRRHTNAFLDTIDKLVDWKAIEKKLVKKYKKTASADGRPAYRSPSHVQAHTSPTVVRLKRSWSRRGGQ